MPTNNHINYIEFAARDLNEIKTFYTEVFGWEFTDYEPTYVAFSNSGLEGGFEQSDQPVKNGALVILYHNDLKKAKQKVLAAGGRLTKDIFDFPGGKRFHFADPQGNELAVWSE